MTNRKYLEIAQLCSGDVLINESDIEAYKAVLDSEVSIKRFIEEFKDIRYHIKWTILNNIFTNFKRDTDREWVLNYVLEVAEEYKKYLTYKYDYSMAIVELTNALDTIDSLEDVKWLRCVNKNSTINLKTLRYHIHREKDSSLGGMSLRRMGEEITGIGAIILKDEEYEIMKVYNEEEKEKMIKRLERFDYDLAIIT